MKECLLTYTIIKFNICIYFLKFPYQGIFSIPIFLLANLWNCCFLLSHISSRFYYHKHNRNANYCQFQCSFYRLTKTAVSQVRCKQLSTTVLNYFKYEIIYFTKAGIGFLKTWNYFWTLAALPLYNTSLIFRKHHLSHLQSSECFHAGSINSCSLI